MSAFVIETTAVYVYIYIYIYIYIYGSLLEFVCGNIGCQNKESIT